MSRSRPSAMSSALIVPLALGAGLGAASADEAVDLATASKQFLNSCGVCHTVEPSAEIRQGPNLRTVFGRQAGTLDEFPTFSDALKKAGAEGVVWNDETLDKWITNAGAYIAGTMMPYQQPDPAKRKLIIAYLRHLATERTSEAKPSTP